MGSRLKPLPSGGRRKGAVPGQSGTAEARAQTPTIKDVARAAGVSVTTVSHVFNETRPVAAETQARVRAAIDELGYTPSTLARALKGERTGTIGMLATSSTNPFFAEVISGVEERCFELGYSLILCNTREDRERMNAQLSTMLQKRIDGLVVMTTNCDSGIFQDLRSLRGLRLVAIDTDDLEQVIVVNDDSELGGGLAARYLVGRGFRRIAVLAGPVQHPRARRRLSGFSAALGEHGLALDQSLVYRTDLTLGSGSRAMQRLLAEQERPPEALFCMNDLTAVGAMHAAHQAGLQVPDDLSVIGYDDIEMAAYSQPPLTTIRQPTLDIGRTAAQRLIEMVEGAEETVEAVSLPPRLVERQSVGFGPGHAASPAKESA